MSADVSVQPITVAAGLARFRPDPRRFLTGVSKTVVAEAILVAAMLAADAVRDGAPAVTMWVRRPGHGGLRVELRYHRTSAAESAPYHHRRRILDRVGQAHGASLDMDGLVTLWVEFAPDADEAVAAGRAGTIALLSIVDSP